MQALYVFAAQQIYNYFYSSVGFANFQVSIATICDDFARENSAPAPNCSFFRRADKNMIS